MRTAFNARKRHVSERLARSSSSQAPSHGQARPRRQEEEEAGEGADLEAVDKASIPVPVQWPGSALSWLRDTFLGAAASVPADPSHTEGTYDKTRITMKNGGQVQTTLHGAAQAPIQAVQNHPDRNFRRQDSSTSVALGPRQWFSPHHWKLVYKRRKRQRQMWNLAIEEASGATEGGLGEYHIHICICI